MLPKKSSKTLLEFAGFSTTPVSIEDSILLLIDYQKEYTEGRLKLPNHTDACQVASELLSVFRKARAPIIHVIHQSASGAALFNPDTDMVSIPELLSPKDDETVITKSLPNAFTNTKLEAALVALGRQRLVIAGFMTHMCVESTTRAASELGFWSVVIANACATRALPDPMKPGEIIYASEVHRNSLAALSDRFATIVNFNGEEFK